MSYDVYLSINTGKEQHIIQDCGNYTSNVWKMYRKAFRPPGQEEDSAGIQTIHGMLAKDAEPLLHMAIRAMMDDRVFYRSLNPENGWGNYEGALKYLQDIHTACIEHPACTIEVSS